MTPYADRGLVTREQWNGIIRGATRELWLYGMAEYGYASDTDVPAILQRATARGCRVLNFVTSRPKRENVPYSGIA